MAVADRYVDTNRYASDGTLNTMANANSTYPVSEPGGAKVRSKSINFLTVNGDSAGSVLRLFKDLPAEIIPIRLEIWTDGITSMNSNKVGLYKHYDGGTAGAVTANGAASMGTGIDLSSQVTNASPKDGLNNMAIGDLGTKRLWEIAGDAVVAVPETRQPGYDLAITVNSGSCGSAGNIRATLYWLES